VHLFEVISAEIEAAKNKRNKMLFVVTRHNQEELKRAIEMLSIPSMNLSLQLSEKLKLLPPEKRPFELGRVLRALIASQNKDVVFLDRIEYLFDTELKQNPIRLLENVSSNQTLIIHWPGMLDGGALIYATSEHPEFYSSDKSYSSYVIEV
jgi:hypothetical protein